VPAILAVCGRNLPFWQIPLLGGGVRCPVGLGGTPLTLGGMIQASRYGGATPSHGGFRASCE